MQAPRQSSVDSGHSETHVEIEDTPLDPPFSKMFYLQKKPGDVGLKIKHLNKTGHKLLVDVSSASDDETMDLDDEVFREERKDPGPSKKNKY